MVHQVLARQGDDCATELHREYPDDSYKYFVAAEVDTSKIDETGDVARIPEEAFSSPGVPYPTKDGVADTTYEDSPFFSMRLTRIGGSWFVVIQ